MAITALDANGVQQTIETLPTAGRKVAAQSLPIAVSSEDKAVLDAQAASLVSILAKIITAPATEAKQDTLNTLITTQNGHLDGVETSLSAILAKIIASPATEALQTALNTLVGAQNATAWASGDGTVISLLKAIAGAAISTTPTTTNQTQVGGSALLTGNGATGAGSPRVTIASDNTPFSVKLAQDEYEPVAASQSDQVIGATGAAGDYLAGVLIVPATTSPGAVSIKDGSGGSAITLFTGGASSVSNLVPFFVPLGIRATSNGWRVTTGANVSALPVGDFT